MHKTSRSRYAFTEAKLKKWDKEGRGKGEGVDYRPWLTTRDVSSLGRRHRMPGILHDRVLHLMSDLERNAVLYFEQQPNVVDIREQFPIDREITRSIASAMGIRHPADPWTKTDIVMTTDLLITYNDGLGQLKTRAFSVKQTSELKKLRSREKQEIERRYWERLGFKWSLLLDGDLRSTKYFNAVYWSRNWFHLPIISTDAAELRQRNINIVLAELLYSHDQSFGAFVTSVCADRGYSSAEVISWIRHLIARRHLRYDFSQGTPTLQTPLSLFEAEASTFALAA